MGFLPRKEKQVEQEAIPQLPKEVETPVEPIKEEVKPEKKEKHRWVVVKELPNQIVRQTTSEEGTVLHFMTTEEALTQIMNE